MEPLAVSTASSPAPPPSSLPAGSPHLLHRLHHAWGYPGSPPAPAPPHSASYEASVVATALGASEAAWAHHPMLATPNSNLQQQQQQQQHGWPAKAGESATPGATSSCAPSGVSGALQQVEESAHDDSGISPGRTSSSGPPSSGGSPPGPSADRPVEHAPSPLVKQEAHDLEDCRSSPVTQEEDSSEASEDTMDSLSRLQMALSQAGSPLGDIYTSGGPEEASSVQCPLCPHAASSLPALAAHLGSHVERKATGDSSELKCSACGLTSPSHDEFIAHLASHFPETSIKPPHSQRRCSVCDFSTKSASKLRAHLAEFHGFEPGENDSAMEDEDVTTPRVNSQGKVKTFRCKQCNFVAVTKLDFWTHSRHHIKGDKVLSCPRCPFVTEYKHHLEYHLRNHSGSKPFKCTQCSYSCVNKSMLNSHLKSHSNVYQYRCADCNYATKYCHSLKLHLRKYTHNPAMVLNPDGTPNPLPIIDVYGTRRGPKTKKDPQQEMHLMQHQKSPPPPPAAPSPLAQPYLANPAPGFMEPEPHRCAQCDFSTGSQEHFAHHLLTAHAVSPPIKPRSPPISIPTPEKTMPQSAPPLLIPQPNPMKDYLTWVYAQQQQHAMDLYQQIKMSSLPEPIVTNPLDLSKEIRKVHERVIEQPPMQQSTTSNKNRRKGKAFKLERIPHCNDEVDDGPLPKIKKLVNGDRSFSLSRQPVVSPAPLAKKLTPSPPPASKEETKCPSPATAEVNGSPSTAESAPSDATYSCNYCDILFRDVVMYTMHMGYHGYKDPFHCNMCGQQTSDKLSFFLHIARSPHC